jgi:chaperonin GroES
MIPLGEKILVKPVSTERVLESGLIIPDAVADRQKASKGQVIAVSKKAELYGFAPGQTVHYRGGKPLKIDDIDHLVLEVGEHNCEVLCIIS